MREIIERKALRQLPAQHNLDKLRDLFRLAVRPPRVRSLTGADSEASLWRLQERLKWCPL